MSLEAELFVTVSHCCHTAPPTSGHLGQYYLPVLLATLFLLITWSYRKRLHLWTCSVHYIVPYHICLLFDWVWQRKKNLHSEAKASEIYVTNSKGTDVAWKDIHKQQKTKSLLFKLCFTIALVFWPYWSSFYKLKQFATFLSHIIFSN